jgi:hypothetical protein
MITAILLSTIAWFVLAAILFFNPVVDKVYGSQEGHPAVRALPKNGSTIGKILLAVFVQCVLWAFIYTWVKGSLPETIQGKTWIFGTIIFLMKMIPRDIDRLLLTTYPNKRLTIEFIIGAICAYAVAAVFAYYL